MKYKIDYWYDVLLYLSMINDSDSRKKLIDEYEE